MTTFACGSEGFWKASDYIFSHVSTSLIFLHEVLNCLFWLWLLTLLPSKTKLQYFKFLWDLIFSPEKGHLLMSLTLVSLEFLRHGGGGSIRETSGLLAAESFLWFSPFMQKVTTNQPLLLQAALNQMIR